MRDGADESEARSQEGRAVRRRLAEEDRLALLTAGLALLVIAAAAFVAGLL